MATEALIQQMEGKVVAHIDMDCFYVQVEQRRDESLRGQPVAVIQYNPNGDLQDVSPDENRRCDHSDGSLIAVSYEARAKGVKRIMRGKEARQVCPDLILIQVPVAHKKSDINLYREAGAEVVNVLARFSSACERASIDEVYCDITDAALLQLREIEGNFGSELGPTLLDEMHSTWVAGYEQENLVVLSKEEVRNGHSAISSGPDSGDGQGEWWRRPLSQWKTSERLLAAGAQVVTRMRRAVLEETSFSCSAGISHNKILAKLGSGLHKPNQQTILPTDAAQKLMQDLPISRLKGLGGEKLGKAIQEEFHVETVGELQKVPCALLVSKFGDSPKPPGGLWVFRIAKGICLQPVKDQELAKSRGSGKDFLRSKFGALHDFEKIERWLREIVSQVHELLLKDRERLGRVATNLTVIFREDKENHKTRSCALRQPYALDRMVGDLLQAIKKEYSTGRRPAIASIFVSASNFQDLPKGNKLITNFWKSQDKPADLANSEPAHEESKGCLSSGQEPAQPPMSPQTVLTAGDRGQEEGVPVQEERRRTVPYGSGKIDEEVLKELPKEIQEEIRLSMKISSHRSSASSSASSSSAPRGIDKFFSKSPAARPEEAAEGKRPTQSNSSDRRVKAKMSITSFFQRK